MLSGQCLQLVLFQHKDTVLFKMMLIESAKRRVTVIKEVHKHCLLLEHVSFWYILQICLPVLGVYTIYLSIIFSFCLPVRPKWPSFVILLQTLQSLSWMERSQNMSPLSYVYFNKKYMGRNASVEKSQGIRRSVAYSAMYIDHIMELWMRRLVGPSFLVCNIIYIFDKTEA